jgi:hypothetical protein
MTGRRLNFEIDTELEPSLLTARAGIPSLIEVLRLTGVAGVVDRSVGVKTRKRSSGQLATRSDKLRWNDDAWARCWVKCDSPAGVHMVRKQTPVQAHGQVFAAPHVRRSATCQSPQKCQRSSEVQ